MFGKIVLIIFLACLLTTCLADEDSPLPPEENVDAMAPLLEKPWCSYGDGRNKRFSVKARWKGKKEFDYHIFNYPSNKVEITDADVDRIIDSAWSFWSGGKVGLKFTNSKLETATMKIAFVAGKHSDIYPFDGEGKVLAHGFYPPDGKIHFDNDEKWGDKKDKGKQLLYVAIHEFGHALGLDHSNVSSAVMFKSYTGYKDNIVLDEDDIHGIESAFS